MMQIIAREVTKAAATQVSRYGKPKKKTSPRDDCMQYKYMGHTALRNKSQALFNSRREETNSCEKPQGDLYSYIWNCFGINICKR